MLKHSKIKSTDIVIRCGYPNCKMFATHIREYNGITALCDDHTGLSKMSASMDMLEYETGPDKFIVLVDDISDRIENEES